MSSSDEFPDWEVFWEREVPFDVEILSPASETAAALQQCVSDVLKAREETETVRSKGLAALSSQAVLVFQLEKALALYEANLRDASLTKIYRHLRVLKDQMLDALKAEGIEIIVPIEAPFHEIADSVHVQGWRHGERYHEEIVSEVLEPVVKYHGEIVHLGRVIMGAPVETTDETVSYES